MIYANSLLNLYRKKAHANKVKVVWVYYITVNMKICLYEIKYQLDKESLSIKNNTSVLVNVDNTIRLQRNYLLFSRDMEMVLKNFQYRHFLYPELIGNRINANKIKLISSNKKIKSTINIDKNELSVIFRKKGNLSRYYTEISINIISIITENVYSEIKPLLHKITNKMSYTEITNDKIITYSISEVIYKKYKNVIFTKEEMYYNDLRDILNNQIIYCIGDLCKKNKIE